MSMIIGRPLNIIQITASYKNRFLRFDPDVDMASGVVSQNDTVTNKDTTLVAGISSMDIRQGSQTETTCSQAMWIHSAVYCQLRNISTDLNLCYFGKYNNEPLKFHRLEYLVRNSAQHTRIPVLKGVYIFLRISRNGSICI